MALRINEQAIMSFLNKRIFQPILTAPNANAPLKQGVHYTIMRMKQRDAIGMVQYYWSTPNEVFVSQPEYEMGTLNALKKLWKSFALELMARS